MTDAPGASPSQDSAISGLVDRAQGLASNVAASAQDKARQLAEEQKSAAAEQVEEVARVLDTAAEQVERVLPEAAQYVRDAASGVHRVSSAVRDQSVDDMIDMVTTFARNQPGLFLAGSVFAGFAVARFLKSSADRRWETESTGASAGGGRSGSKSSGSRSRGGSSGGRRSASADGMNSGASAAGADRSR
jgi:ABC-type transporter Mla subunit MlaD